MATELNEDTKKKLKEVQLEILMELKRICEKHNLRYFLAYGTLLGAIRHQGFIPWDDDIDVMMPYPDLLKFEQICVTELDTKRFFYQSPETDPEYRLTINRIRRNNTILLEEPYKNKKMHHGIYIDIYPMYGVPQDRKKRKKQVFEAMKRALFLLGTPVQNRGLIMKIGSTLMLKTKTKKGADKAQKELFKKISQYDYDESDFVACLDSSIAAMKRTYEKKHFGNGVSHNFESHMFVVPENSDAVLKGIYVDYMQLPPIEKRVFHHNYVRVEFGDLG